MSSPPSAGPRPTAPSTRRPLLFPAALQHRAERAGAGPLVTFYDRAADVRTELSGTSFANWVDKTANLLVDELDVVPGDTVALPLLRHSPGHWVSLVWVAACWRARAAVLPGVPGGPADAVLEVVGPDRADEPPTPGLVRVACSLHPLGLGFGTPLPAGVLDFSTEARMQPDVYLGGPVAADDPAWRSGGTRIEDGGAAVLVDQRGLVDRDEDGDRAGGTGERVLVVPGPPWETVAAALLAPVLGQGSVVVVTGADPDDLARLAGTERVDRTVDLG